jgi:hypothetical protein
VAELSSSKLSNCDHSVTIHGSPRRRLDGDELTCRHRNSPAVSAPPFQRVERCRSNGSFPSSQLTRVPASAIFGTCSIPGEIACSLFLWECIFKSLRESLH